MSQELVPRREPIAPAQDAGALDALLGAARFAARTWLRGAAWGAGLSVRVVRIWGDSRAASELARELRDGLREVFQDLLDVSDVSLDQRIRRLLPPDAAPVDSRGRDGRTDIYALRQQATELLRQAADVYYDDDVHPAYARILLELAPDEARILRLLVAEGPQPAIDVRALALIGSRQTVAEGLNMICQAAGALDPERGSVYLDNLTRLGLIRFSGEPLEEPMAYQVLEAQPHVLTEVKQAGRARTVQRSIRLTLFGEGFCRACLPPQEREPDSDPSPRLR